MNIIFSYSTDIINRHPTKDYKLAKALSLRQLAKQVCQKYPYNAIKFKDGYRKGENNEYFTNLLIFDIDNKEPNKLSLKEAKELLEQQNINALLITTKSHQTQKDNFVDKYRVLIPLAQKLNERGNKTLEDYKTHSKILIELIATKLGFGSYIDKACVNLHQYYNPSPKYAEIMLTKNTNETLDISNIQQEANEIFNKQKERELQEEQESIKNSILYEEANMSKIISNLKHNSKREMTLKQVNYEKIFTIDPLELVRHYDNIEREYSCGNYHYIETLNCKFCSLENGRAGKRAIHDFKSATTYNAYRLMECYLQTQDPIVIAKELESIYQI